MSGIRLVTTRDLQGKNPLFPSSGLMDEFVLMNMYPEGIWLVDKQYIDFESIKATAILIAKTFNDQDAVAKLEAL